MGFFKGNIATGAIIGAAAAVAGREVLPAVGQAVRPLLRTTMKMGMVGYEKMREGFSHIGESFEDVAAEVRSEIATSNNGGGVREETAREPRKRKETGEERRAS